MPKQDRIKLIAGLLLAAVAGMLVFRSFRHGSDSDGMVYFYDLSEQKLFPAPRASIPPIRGINNEDADGVRAIVVSDSGDTKDRKRQRIAYLEKYTPELKAQFEAARSRSVDATSNALTIPREVVPANTLVRRLTDKEWYPMNSTEGEKIVTEWNVPGADGAYPSVCVP
jgi:hypothetical protein